MQMSNWFGTTLEVQPRRLIVITGWFILIACSLFLSEDLVDVFYVIFYPSAEVLAVAASFILGLSTEPSDRFPVPTFLLFSGRDPIIFSSFSFWVAISIVKTL